MKPIHFVAPIAPCAKGRGRTFRVGGRVVVATPERTRRWEAAFAAIAAQHAPPEPLDEALEVRWLFVLPRPANKMGRKHPDGLLPMAGRPDVDNLAKAGMDALKAWWRDDARVVTLVASKRYAERNGLPRVEVTILPAEVSE